MLRTMLGLAAIAVSVWGSDLPAQCAVQSHPSPEVSAVLGLSGRGSVPSHSYAVHQVDATWGLPLTMAITPDPSITALVSAVSGDTLIKCISQLTGYEPVVIGGVLDTLLTRYTFSPKSDAAAEYLRERLEGFGYDVELEEFVVGNYRFLGGDFVSADDGWAVGTAVLRTTDGGLTWQGGNPGLPGSIFLDACRIDSLRGWIVGTDAQVLRSDNGGATWTAQTPPVGFGTLLAVAFLDSLNGWIAGDLGVIARTSDGGATWTQVPSGTSSPLWGLHFESSTRGWACGQDGVVLAWDGSSWTPQTTGTVEAIYDIHFLDDLNGWAVGSNRTILKTTDGGVTWIACSTPPLDTTHLNSVCFTSLSDGWATGTWGTVLHTSTGGASWEATFLGPLPPMWYVEFFDGANGRIVGDESGLFRSQDGGATWIGQTQNLPEWASTRTVNVVATKPGSVLAEEEVIVCGHYDSITMDDPMTLAPGADDDASGTAAVVEAARAMAGRHFERTLKFICFAAEEQGDQGSYFYVCDAVGAGDSVVAVIDFDQIGYVDQKPEFIDILYNTESTWLRNLLVECGAAYLPTFGIRTVLNSYVLRSDYAPFWAAGYPAISGYSDLPPVSPNQHTSSDTLGTINKPFVANCTRLAVATLAELAVPDTVTAGVAGGQGGGSGAAAAGDVGPLSAVAATPNPFTASTVVAFNLGSRADVDAAVFDTGGRRVRTLATGPLAAGAHRLDWDGRDSRGDTVSPGVYFVRVKAEGRAERSAKIVNIR